MNIHIKKVSFNKTGPFVKHDKKFSEVFAPLTIIYGKNESGKTTIIENIVKGIFGSKTSEKIRSGFTKAPKIILDVNGQEIKISKKTFEDMDVYLKSQNIDLPVSLYNLLYVKSADTAITESKNIKTELINLFSERSQLDNLINNITKLPELTKTDLSSYNNHTIEVNSGKLTACYKEKKSKYKRLENLKNELVKHLSENNILSLEQKIEELKNSYEQIQKAKKYHAYTLSLKLKEYDEKLKFPKIKDLYNLKSSAEKYIKDISEIDNKDYSGELNDINYKLEWIDKALNKLNTFQNIPEQDKLLLTLPVSAGALIIISVILFLTNNMLIGIIFSLAAIVCLLFNLSRLKNKNKIDAVNKSIEDLKKDYENIFDKSGNDIQDLSVELNSSRPPLDKRRTELELQDKDKQKKIQRCESEKIQIIQIFKSFNLTYGKENGWLNIIQENITSLEKLTEQKKDDSIKLAKLNIDETDYITEPQILSYSSSDETRVIQELEENKNALNQLKNKSANLKYNFSEFFGKENVDKMRFDDLVRVCDSQLSQQENDIKTLAAKLIAAGMLHNVLEERMKQEDLLLSRCLQSQVIKDEIISMTSGHYKNISFDDKDNFIVTTDQDDEYKFELISTGAKDQIMLGLRVGIAKHLTGKDSMFLIFDDAFQHSDYDRRAKLVVNIEHLVNTGWQVIYCTMDDDLLERLKNSSVRNKKLLLL